MINQILQIIADNNMQNSPIKYKVISGYYDNHYNVKEMIEKVFKKLKPLFTPFEDIDINEDIVIKHNELPSYQFAFDASIGKFVTKQVNFDNVNNKVKSQ